MTKNSKQNITADIVAALAEGLTAQTKVLGAQNKLALALFHAHKAGEPGCNVVMFAKGKAGKGFIASLATKYSAAYRSASDLLNAEGVSKEKKQTARNTVKAVEAMLNRAAYSAAVMSEKKAEPVKVKADGSLMVACDVDDALDGTFSARAIESAARKHFGTDGKRKARAGAGEGVVVNAGNVVSIASALSSFVTGANRSKFSREAVEELANLSEILLDMLETEEPVSNAKAA